MDKYICVHGHFYQPPRENPWLESIEFQDSAFPYHDWNERINDECYEANSASRILENGKYILNIQNNYSYISFNFGPTLLSWMEEHAPETYKAILQADKDSIEYFSGHGSAIAQAYNHMIMPLANRRDKETQIYWGIKDFEHRFNRYPEGMWLPETAVDMESLELLAEYEIKFTILAPRQVAYFRKLGEEEWIGAMNEKIDPTRPYLCKLKNGSEITIFFYDGPASKDIAFQDLLKDGKKFSDRLLSLFNSKKTHAQLVHVATDGETYGHHHRHGEMALSFCLHHIINKKLANITIYGEFLKKNAPEYEVKILENTSWSCDHGVERWKSNCGCHTGGHPDWNQKWRITLREALDWLRNKVAKIYEQEMLPFCENPWEVRNEYISVILDRSKKNLRNFYIQNLTEKVEGEKEMKVMQLLEMQRHAMLMFTSCGWFFDELTGIETIQILQYASRVIQLTHQLTEINLEQEFINILAEAKSNIQGMGNGADVYYKMVKSAVVDLSRVSAHYAIASLFHSQPDDQEISSYKLHNEVYERYNYGNYSLAAGKVNIKSNITLEEKLFNFAVIHLGDHNIICGVDEFTGNRDFFTMYDEIKSNFDKNDIPQLIHLLDKHFGSHHYSFWHLFKDEQRFIMNQILQEKLNTIENTYRELFKNNYATIRVLDSLKIPAPKALTVTGEFIFNSELIKIFEAEEIELKKLKYYVEEFNKFSFELDTKTLGFVISRKITRYMEEFFNNTNNLKILRKLTSLFKLTRRLPLDMNLSKAQNIFFDIYKKLQTHKSEMAKQGDADAIIWIREFTKIGYYLNIYIYNGQA